MKKHMLILPVFLVAVVAFTLGVTAWAQGIEIEEFDEFAVFIEINATDLDAGLQGKLDGEAWNQVTVRGPNGQPIFRFDPGGTLAKHGVTEDSWESNEPPFEPSPDAEEGYTLDDFLELFEEGTYTAEGKMIEGGKLSSETELTHDLPAGPYVTSHEEDDEVVRGSDLVITWDPVINRFEPNDPQAQVAPNFPLAPATSIVGYIVVAEYDVLANAGTDDEEVVLSRALTIDVAPDVFQATIPADFLPDEPAAGLELEFKIEVGAREESGNTTFWEVPLDVVDP